MWPLAVYFLLVILAVGVIIVPSYFFGERHKERTTGEPYESGVPVTGSARLRMSVKFYLIAMFFVIFDVESIFIFAWAIGFRELGWAGYIEVLIFVGILIAALVYLLKQGALDWGMSRRRKRG
jgi:NADH-quinone oxidoreductase subunit A